MPSNISLEKEPSGNSSSLPVKPNEAELKKFRDMGFSALRAKNYINAYNHFNRALKLANDDFLANLGLAIVYTYNYRVDQKDNSKLHICNKQWDRLLPLISKVTETDKKLIKEYCTGVTVGYDMDVFTFVALACCPKMVLLFLQCGFDPNTKHGGQSILHRIVNGSDFHPVQSCEKINLLLNFGANPNARTVDGEGILNSRTPIRHANAIRERFPFLERKDMNPVRKALRPQTNDPSAIGCSMLIILILFSFWIASKLPDSCRGNSSHYTISTTAQPEVGYLVRCKVCDKIIELTKWNQGYCSECNKCTHECAYEGCIERIPNSVKNYFCSLHDE